MRLDPAVAISQLQEAAHLQASVVIGYVDPAGVATQRVVAPINVRGGQLTAYDPASGRVREFAIHRVTSVVSADSGVINRASSRGTANSQRPLAEYVCVTTVLSEAAQAPGRHGLSLLHGWLPPTVQAVAAVVLVVAIGWRSRRWRLVWLPVAIVVGLILAAWTHWYIDSQGLAGDPAPSSLYVWVGLTGLALASRGARLAKQPMASPDGVAGSGAAVPAQRGGGAELLGRLLPDGPGGMERVDRGPAARRDRSAHRHGHAGQGRSATPVRSFP